MIVPLLAGTSLAVSPHPVLPVESASREINSAPREIDSALRVIDRDLLHQRWFHDAHAKGGSHWVANAESDLHAVEIDGQQVPVTVLRGRPGYSSYVTSPHAAWLSYPLAEAMTMVTGWRRSLAQVAGVTLATALATLMRAGGLHRAAVVANHLVSTNLHPRWNVETLLRATRDLTTRFPQRPLMMRSICHGVDADLANALVSAGWRLVPARQVYVVDPRNPAVWKHNHLKRDRKLLAGSDLELVEPHDLRADELPALREVFRQLFIGKHCALNPDFTPAFFSYCREQRFLDLYALRLDGRAVGVLGIMERHGWITTPLIGYDTSLPQNMGIYRRLMALLYVEAQRRDCRLHLSSGAGSFKSARGGEPHLEYSAIYDGHLSLVRRTAIRAFAQFMGHAVPWALARVEVSAAG